jgi:hypothetical protein
MGAGKIIQLVGVLVAVVAGLMGGFPQSPLVIAVLGAVGGYFIVAEERTRVLVATVALAVAGVAGGLNGIPVLGEFITDALGGLTSLFQAGSVAVIVLALFEKLKP